MRIRQAIESIPTVAKKVALGTNLASVSLIGDPRKMLEYVSECLFLYAAFASKRGIPQRNVFQVLPANDIESVNLGNLRSSSWFFAAAAYTADIISLCLICQVMKPKVVFEIGTYRGYTALHFALNTPETARVYTLDLPRDQAVRPRLRTTAIDDEQASFYMRSTERYCFENSPVASKISVLFGDSATFDYSAFHGKIDLFFIDGAHSYDYVRSDTLNALECCHPGSILVWHDFGKVGTHGVSRWILEMAKSYEIQSIPGGSLAFMVVK